MLQNGRSGIADVKYHLMGGHRTPLGALLRRQVAKSLLKLLEHVRCGERSHAMTKRMVAA